MKERSEGSRVIGERKRVSSTDVERTEEEEAIGETFTLSQVVEVAYHVCDIGDQVHKVWYI